MSQPDLIIIDEKPQHIERFQSFLVESPYQIEYFHNAEEALSKLENIRPKVLVLAKDMETMSGEEFMAKFSQYRAWDGMRILIASEFEVEKSDFFSLASLGASDVVVTNSDKTEFLHKVEQLYSSEM